MIVWGCCTQVLFLLSCDGAKSAVRTPEKDSDTDTGVEPPVVSPDPACGTHRGDESIFGDHPELIPNLESSLMGDAPEPRHIMLSWQSEPATSITVTWQTADTSESSITTSTQLQLSLHSDLSDMLVINGEEGNYGPKIGSAHYLPYSDQYQTIHVAEACGLETDTKYFYRVGGTDLVGQESWSDIYHFRTAPSPSIALEDQSYRFVVLGDSRSDPDTWGDVINAAALEDPAFIVHVGDFVSYGLIQSYWDEWFDEAEGVLPYHPFLAVHGNHEGNALNYYAQFALPENEQWYTLDFASLRLVVLNDTTSGVFGKGNSSIWTQETYLGHAMSESDALWKFATHHRPVYSAGNHGGSSINLDSFAPKYDTFWASLVFSGHDHNYERTAPIFDDAKVDNPLEGTTYVVTGGAGAPLRAVGSDWWTAHSESIYHYVLVQIEGRQLSMWAKDLEGNIFDSMTIDATNVDIDSCEEGRSCNPIVIDTFPFTDSRNTVHAYSYDIDAYSCAPETNESGAEYYYSVNIPSKGTLSATLNDTSGGSVDIDIHLLDGISGDTCIVRDNVSFEQVVAAGDYYLVADTWVNSSDHALDGQYEILVEFSEP
ncbi:MAG: metallophosphoesterase family protein [Proteobacteria bacterium]|jgi:acid phosphatase type 7|nr:metallophosphoesterase family protein [Pseudomonadota bacterium]